MKMVWILAGCLLGIALGYAALVEAGPMRGKWWQDPVLKEKIKLTQEQQEKIDKIFDDSRARRREMADKARASEQKINAMLAKVEPDLKAVDEELGRLISIRSDMYREMVNMKLEARKVLTKEQVGLLLKEHPGIFDLGRGWAGTPWRQGRGRFKRP